MQQPTNTLGLSKKIAKKYSLKSLFVISSEEEGEEASEDKDSTEEANGVPSTTHKSIFKSAPSRKLDLSAAAHYHGLVTESSTVSEDPATSITSSDVSNMERSSSKDFFDFFAGSPPKSNQSSATVSPVAKQTADPFAAFETAPESGDDAGFADFSNGRYCTL